MADSCHLVKGPFETWLLNEKDQTFQMVVVVLLVDVVVAGVVVLCFILHYIQQVLVRG